MADKKKINVRDFEWDPLEFILTHIEDPALSTHDRIAVATQLMKYYYPTKKELTVEGNQHKELLITWGTEVDQGLLTDESLSTHVTEEIIKDE